MPAYDWIRSSDFRTAVRTRVEQRLSEANIQGMPYTFTNMLADIATENQPLYESRAAQRVEPVHSVDDALASVDTIISTAISLTRAAERNMLNQDDLTKAIEMRFCRIWPFCR